MVGSKKNYNWDLGSERVNCYNVWPTDRWKINLISICRQAHQTSWNNWWNWKSALDLLTEQRTSNILDQANAKIKANWPTTLTAWVVSFFLKAAAYLVEVLNRGDWHFFKDLKYLDLHSHWCPVRTPGYDDVQQILLAEKFFLVIIL